MQMAYKEISEKGKIKIENFFIKQNQRYIQQKNFFCLSMHNIQNIQTMVHLIFPTGVVVPACTPVITYLLVLMF